MPENQLNIIEADSIQKKIIDDFATIISKDIPISKMVIKEYLMWSLKEWQKLHKMTILDTETGRGSTPEERIKQATEILDLFKSQVINSIKNDLNPLNMGINNAINHYIKHFANR
ncbi:MAG: hypothetical protein ACFFAJ_18680 [Candidatus Hodarchaeota archaeon]